MRTALAIVVALAVLPSCGADSSGDGETGDVGSAGGDAGAGRGAGGAGGTTGGAGGTGVLAACDAITTIETGKSPFRELHVSEGGDDANDGTAETPFATIEKAASVATPGTAIRIHEGTYAGGSFISGLSGTEAAPVWLGGAPGEAPPVFDGGGQAFQLQRVRYVVIHDIEVQNAANNGINCDDGGEYANPDATRYVVFRNLDIHDIGGSGNQDCLKLSGVDDFWVLDSRFARCGGGGSGSGIDQVGCHRGVIARSTFTEMSGNAVQCKGGSEDIEIVRNWITDGGARGVNMGGSTGFEFFRPPLSSAVPNFEVRDIRVIANVIEGSAAALAYAGCVDCLVANNTMVDPVRWVLRILQETTTRDGYAFLEAANGRFVNNLVYFDHGQLSTYVNVGPNTKPDSFRFETNLWYAYDDPSQSSPTLPVPEDGGTYGEDPELRDPAGGNFTVRRSSPASGNGTAVSEVHGDFLGRCYATPPSVGAYEPN